MNWTTLICFVAGIGIYLIGLGIYTVVKRSKNKKKFDKEVQEHEEAKSQENTNSTNQVSNSETKGE